MTDMLTEICAAKRQHIARRKKEFSEDTLRKRIEGQSKPRGFKNALQKKVSAGGIGLIAEIKKASPSKGIIREDFNPASLAKSYEAGGATCLSVLTDEPYFQGSDEYLAASRDTVSLPVLRKDFMLDPYQILESRALGADCVLLIMAALSDKQVQELEKTAFQLNMDVLVEVHDKDELDRALSQLKSPLIGINNRNLKTLSVNMEATESLAKYLPAPILGVCESGIATHGDIEHIRRVGISCFLVGESLMREADVTRATQKLLGLTHG